MNEAQLEEAEDDLGKDINTQILMMTSPDSTWPTECRNSKKKQKRKNLDQSSKFQEISMLEKSPKQTQSPSSSCISIKTAMNSATSSTCIYHLWPKNMDMSNSSK